MKKLIFSMVFMMTVQAGAESMDFMPPVQTVSSVDLQQYLGKWYEFAAIPQSFEKQCVANTTAEYAVAEKGLIAVVNSCEKADGQRSVANGRAKVADKSTRAKLKVTFVNLFGWQFSFGGDYWILGLGENYSYAVVGAPGRDYAWILSRSPQLSQAQINEAAAVLVTQGFDPCKLITTIHSSGLQEKVSLCQITTQH